MGTPLVGGIKQNPTTISAEKLKKSLEGSPEQLTPKKQEMLLFAPGTLNGLNFPEIFPLAQAKAVTHIAPVREATTATVASGLNTTSTFEYAKKTTSGTEIHTQDCIWEANQKHQILASAKGSSGSGDKQDGESHFLSYKKTLEEKRLEKFLTGGFIA